MTKRDELIALDPAGLEAAVRECARITAPEISDVEYERIKADNSPRYQNTRAEMERTLRAYLNAARSQPNVQPALEAPAAGDGEPAFPTWDAEDEAYELGKLYGYESAIQDLDIATGGDGEFKGSTIPGCTVDVPGMKARIVGRANTAPPADAGMREAFVRVLASLAAAISILERTPKAKRAVASDKMFDQMLDDYRKALEAGRSALTAPGATTKSDGGGESK